MKRGLILCLILLCLITSSVSALTIKDITIAPQSVEVGSFAEISIVVDSPLKIISVDGFLTYPNGSSVPIKFETKDDITFTFLFENAEKEGGYGLDVVVTNEKESTKAFAKFEVVPVPEPIPAPNTTNITSVASVDFVKQVQNVTNVKSVQFTQKIVNQTTMFIGGTEYQPFDDAKVFTQLIEGSTPINNATCFVTIFYPNNTLLLNQTPMIYLLNSEGLYYYNLVAPNVTGVYPISIMCRYYTYTQSYFPLSYSSPNYINGSVANLTAIDQNYMFFRDNYNQSLWRLPVYYNFTNVIIPTSSLNLILYLSGWSLYPMNVSIYNYNTSQWEVLPNKLAPLTSSDLLVSNLLSANLSNYVSSNITQIKINYSNQPAKPTQNYTIRNDDSSKDIEVNLFSSDFGKNLSVSSCKMDSAQLCLYAKQVSINVSNFTSWERDNTDYIDETNKTSVIDGVYWALKSDFQNHDYGILNGTIFQNGTIVNLYVKSVTNNKQWYLTSVDGSVVYASFTSPLNNSFFEWRNLTLTNITGSVNTIVLSDDSQGGSREMKIDYIQILSNNTPVTQPPLYFRFNNFTTNISVLNTSSYLSQCVNISDYKDNLTQGYNILGFTCPNCTATNYWVLGVDTNSPLNGSLNTTTSNGSWQSYPNNIMVWLDYNSTNCSDVRFDFLRLDDTYYIDLPIEDIRGGGELHITNIQTQNSNLLNQILSYLTNTIYPYLTQIWNKLLNIETQLNATINISTQINQTTALIKNDTETIITKINDLNTSMQQGFAEKDAHIQNAYDNMTSQINNLSQNVSSNFNFTWGLINSINSSLGNNNNNSVILSYLQNITLAINTTQTQIANVNQSLTNNMNSINISLSGQIINASNTTNTLINNLNISNQARFDQLQSFLQNLSIQISNNQNITQQNLSDLRSLMLSVNLSLTTDISTLNVSLYNVRSDLLSQINQSYQFMVAMNNSILNQLLNLSIQLNNTRTEINNNINNLNTSLWVKMDEAQNRTEYAISLIENLSFQIASENESNQDVLDYLLSMNTNITNNFGNVTNEFNYTWELITNASQNTNFTQVLNAISNLSTQVSNNQNITQQNITQIFNNLDSLNQTCNQNFNSLNSSISNFSDRVDNYMVWLNGTLVEMKSEISNIENMTLIINQTTININNSVTWIVNYLNISTANLSLIAQAPSRCLNGTNWLLWGQVRNRFGVIQSPLENMQCNATTDLWGTDNMSYSYLNQKFEYTHICNPSNTTFNWSVTCDYTS